ERHARRRRRRSYCGQPVLGRLVGAARDLISEDRAAQRAGRRGVVGLPMEESTAEAAEPGRLGVVLAAAGAACTHVVSRSFLPTVGLPPARLPVSPTTMTGA